jgi:hypothetical protein
MHLELQFCSPFVGAGQPLNVQVCKCPHDAQEDTDSWLVALTGILFLRSRSLRRAPRAALDIRTQAVALLPRVRLFRSPRRKSVAIRGRSSRLVSLRETSAENR